MKRISIALGLLATLTACSADTSKEEATTTTTDDTEGSVAAVEDVGALKLSSLAIELPAALNGSSSSLRLAGGKRSVEACQMGQTVKEVTKRVSSVANFACHIEAEKDKIIFGNKTKITFQGQEFGRLWVQKDGEKISFAMCQDSDENKNKQLIEITKVTEFGPAGSLFETGSNTYEGQEQSWTSSMSFDFTAEGTSSMEAKDNFKAGGTNEFLREVSLLLKEAGVSEVALASKGSWNNQQFSQRGAGKFNGSYGNALFENSGTSEFQGSSQTLRLWRRVCWARYRVPSAGKHEPTQHDKIVLRPLRHRLIG